MKVKIEYENQVKVKGLYVPVGGWASFSTYEAARRNIEGRIKNWPTHVFRIVKITTTVEEEILPD